MSSWQITAQSKRVNSASCGKTSNDEWLRQRLAERLQTDGTWVMTDIIKRIVRNTIRRLPKAGVSEDEVRCPTSSQGLRAFLVKFFGRHYLQIQNSLAEYAVSCAFLDKVRSGRVRVLDIGCGPAVSGLAIAEIVRNASACLKRDGLSHPASHVTMDVVLNDTQDICIATAKDMLRQYFQCTSGNAEGVLLDVREGFPGNMRRLQQVSRRLGGFDLVCLSYVVRALSERESARHLAAGIQEVLRLMTPGGRLMIIQDQFRQNLMSRLAGLLGARLHAAESRQEVFPSAEARREYTYSFLYCLLGPSPAECLTT